ncbi:MAG: hypothetical protein QW802_00005, partial [Candidatus Altiarchaeota archaeon]
MNIIRGVNTKINTKKLIFFVFFLYLVIVFQVFSVEALGCRYSDGTYCYSNCCPTGEICASTGSYGYKTCNTNTGSWGYTLYPSNSCTGSCYGTTTYRPTTTTTMPPQYCTVNVRVLDCYTYQQISGVTLHLNGQTAYSSSTGYTTFYNVPVGYRTVYGSKAGYTSASESFYCSCSQTHYVDLRMCPITTTTTYRPTTTTTMPPQYCTVNVRVLDCYTYQQISGVTLNLNGQTAYSSSTGYTTFYNVPIGYRTVYGSKAGYTSASESFYCSCSQTHYVDLRMCPITTTTTYRPTTTTTMPLQCGYLKIFKFNDANANGVWDY